VAALKAEGIEYRGALYAGLMLTADGPKVLEYNCRFGDPETQVILPRLESDLLPILLGSAGVEGYELAAQECQWTRDAAVCVVMAAHNYPATPRKGDVILGLDATRDALVFHAGTSARGEEIVTSGGRVLGVSALGEDFRAARANAYAAVDKISFEGAHFRRDIGWRCL
jgi:phosphoribosylamine--glycine ligase